MCRSSRRPLFRRSKVSGPPGGHGPRPGPAGPPRRLVLTGGGTGGHLYPAISIARALGAGPERQTPNATTHSLGTPLTPVFIGTRSGLEARVVPEAGFEFHAVSSRKITRSLSVGTLLSL